MGGEGMPKRVATRTLRHACPCRRFLDRALDDRFIDVMPPLLSGLGIRPTVFLRKDPLPAPISRGVGIFAVQSVGHLDPPTPCRGTLESQQRY